MRWALLLGLAVVTYALPASADEPEPQPLAAEPPAEPIPPAPTSVLIDANDDTGLTVTNATLIVDDKTIAYELDGKALSLPPGPHTITLQRNDGSHARVSQTVDLQGPTVLRFDFPKPVAPAAPASETTRAPIGPRIVVGAGLVAVVTGTVLILARPTIPGNCDADKGTCTKLASETDAQAADDRDRAGRYRGLTHAGVITVIAGGIVAAGGLVWYVLARPQQPTAALAPWLAPGSGGVVAQGTF